MYRWGRLTLMAKVQNEVDSSWGAGKQWGKSLRNAWHFWPDDGLDKMTIMDDKPDAPHFTLCHQPLTTQVSVSLASGKGGTIPQRLGTPAPDQDIWRIHNDKTISQVMNLELRTRRGLCDRGYGVGSLIHTLPCLKSTLNDLINAVFYSVLTHLLYETENAHISKGF